MARTAETKRKTKETDITVSIDIDGKGHSKIATGVGFLDHMLELLAAHSLCDITVTADGDIHVDDHHTVEDIGICLGHAFDEAMGNKKGIVRYGLGCVPMDDALVHSTVDISGRPYLAYSVEWQQERIKTFETALVEEFWHAFVMNARITLHIRQLAGHNAHHVCEALYKSVARALRQAVGSDERQEGIPSTKGVI